MLFSVKAAAAVMALATTTLADKNDGDNCNQNTNPRQIRLAYGGDKGMAVSWNTNQQLSQPTVYYGKDIDQLNKVASSQTSITYASSSTWNNHVVIDNLNADTTYYYRVQCDNEVHSFTTALANGKGDSFQFAMVGDMGTMGPDGLSTTVGKGAANPLKSGDKTTMQSLQDMKSSYEFIWHVGDIAYADAWLNEEKQGYIKPLNTDDHGAEYDKILNEFYDEVEVLSEDRPYMVAAGNHEANCDNGANLTICVPGQSNFTGYIAHWKMPSEPSSGLSNFWYSFDYGMVHFVIFNTETDFPGAPDEPGGDANENAGPFAPPDTQLAWLENDLASVNRKKTPWIIVGGHRPWYVSTTTCPQCQAAFEPLFIKYNVDLVLHGHKHFYERHAAVANGVTQEIQDNPTSPWYIVNGAGGHYDGLDNPKLPLVPTSRKVVVTYGWSLFTVHNCTHLSTQFIASGNGSVLDTATLYKNRDCNVD